jgi:hypothetical protein
MRFDPKTEEQIDNESLLAAGEYDFEVAEAEDTQSKKGNDMLVLTLAIEDGDGQVHKVTDYIVEAVAYKIRHLASGVGLLKEYESGNLPAHLLKGRTGKCKIRVEPAKGDFRAKNTVNDYVKEWVQPAPRTQSLAKELDDDIPF